MKPSYTINRLYDEYRECCPDSQLSLRAIRNAVKDGSLPSVPCGNRNLVRWDVFEKWTEGRLNE